MSQLVDILRQACVNTPNGNSIKKLMCRSKSSLSRGANPINPKKRREENRADVKVVSRTSWRAGCSSRGNTMAYSYVPVARKESRTQSE